MRKTHRMLYTLNDKIEKILELLEPEEHMDVIGFKFEEREEEEIERR